MFAVFATRIHFVHFRNVFIGARASRKIWDFLEGVHVALDEYIALPPAL